MGLHNAGTGWLPVFFLFQCTICLRLLQASLGNLFAVAPKIPRSCSSALWTAVLASSPPCIPKAEGSPSLSCISRTLESLVTSHFHTLISLVKDANQIHGASRVTGSLEGRTGWSDLTFLECLHLFHPPSVCWARWQAGISFQREFRVSL